MKPMMANTANIGTMDEEINANITEFPCNYFSLPGAIVIFADIPALY